MFTKDGYYELRIFTENNELKKMYQEKIEEHNRSINEDFYADSGFDLLIPNNIDFYSGSTFKINHEIKCCMVFHTYKKEMPSAYYLYPRSSTGTKTPLRLANSVGIIDSGYRGNIIAAFDNMGNKEYSVERNSRLVQICSPNLQPFLVSIVNNLTDLGATERGSGGFGSTGK